MRYPAGHKEAVRQRIIETASRMLRQEGIAAVSIPALMEQAGLTHGGFYRHFKDRNELVAEAIRHAASDTAERVLSPNATENVEALLQAYLSEDHLNLDADGCVLVALGTEANRTPGEVQASIAETARGFLRRLEERLHPENDGATFHDDTLAVGARMVGALLLARLVRQDETLARQLLCAAREADMAEKTG